MNNVFQNFSSLTKWLDYAENDHPNDGTMFVRASATPEKSWAGISTKEEAFTLFRMGYPEGLHRMREIVDSLQSTIILPTPHDTFTCDITGSSPNVEAYVQGIPEDMFVIEQIEEEAPPSHIILQFELAYSSFITSLQAMWAGATIFAAMEALRAQGCSTTILMTHTVQSLSTKAYWQASAPIPPNIDLDSLCFIFTHPALFRVIVFSMMEHEPPDIRNEFGFHFNDGYGLPASIPSPLAHVQLQMHEVTKDLTAYTPEQLLPQAQALLNRIVQTQFGFKKLLPSI